MLYLLLQRKCKRAQRKLAFNLPSAAFLLQRYDFSYHQMLVRNMSKQQPNRAFFLRFGYRITYSLAKSSIFFFDLAKESLAFSNIFLKFATQ